MWCLGQSCLRYVVERMDSLKEGILSSMAKSKEYLFYKPKLFYLLCFLLPEVKLWTKLFTPKPAVLYLLSFLKSFSSYLSGQKLKLQSGEITREEKQPASAQSTPSSTPHSSPKQKSRWASPVSLPSCSVLLEKLVLHTKVECKPVVSEGAGGVDSSQSVGMRRF